MVGKKMQTNKENVKKYPTKQPTNESKKST